MNLMEASNQWATRPDDERFWTLNDMLAAATAYREAAEERTYSPGDLQVCQTGDTGLALRRRNEPKSGNGFFSHYSLRQLNTLVQGPTRNDAFGRIPAELAARNLNWALENYKGEETKVLWNKSTQTARAFTSTGYGRIWNETIIKKLLPLLGQGWQVPPARPVGSGDTRARAATPADVMASRNRAGGGAGIQVGDPIAPAGLYLSEKDMFAFLVNESRPINGGGKLPLYRGFFIGNSEVGDKAFWVKAFLYNMVCGNHIVWDASKVEHIKIVHRGEFAGDRAFKHLAVELTRYSDASASATEQRIVASQQFLLGKDASEVIQTLYGIAPKGVLADAHVKATEHADDGANCSPNSAWGMAQGLTRLSQDCKHADERVKLDMAAGKVLDTVPF